VTRALGAVLLVLTASAAHAAVVDSVEVDRQEGRYSVEMKVRLNVSRETAFDIMSDVDALPRINHHVIRAERRADGSLYSVVEMCVAFFCGRVEQLQTVHTDPPMRLRMRIIPERSDFRYGRAEWRFHADGPDKCRLHFYAEMEPDFWIPPLIGPWLVQRKMQEQAVITSNGIERVAGARD